MRTIIVAVGVFVFIFGCALIAVSPVLASASLYRAELGQVAQGQSGGNVTALYQTESKALNQIEGLSILGAILAATGGAISAYGLLAVRHQGQVHESESPRPAETA
jgi:hypothetical protein